VRILRLDVAATGPRIHRLGCRATAALQMASRCIPCGAATVARGAAVAKTPSPRSPARRGPAPRTDAAESPAPALRRSTSRTTVDQIDDGQRQRHPHAARQELASFHSVMPCSFVGLLEDELSSKALSRGLAVIRLAVAVITEPDRRLVRKVGIR